MCMCKPGMEFATTPTVVSAARRSKNNNKEGVCKPGRATGAVRGERGIREERTKNRGEGGEKGRIRGGGAGIRKERAEGRVVVDEKAEGSRKKWELE